MEQGTIKIHTGFFFLQFLLFFCKTLISIDGSAPEKHSWGESTHQVSPGQHTVVVETQYFFRTVAKASTTVQVGAGETVALKYRVPIIVFMSGKLKVA